MKTSRAGQSILVMTTVLLVLGCAGSQILVVRPMEKETARHSTLYFSTGSSVFDDVSREMSDLEEEVASKIKESGMFRRVWLGECAHDCDSALYVRADVTKIKKVSGTERFFLGVFAGRASMTVTVVVVEPSSLDTLGSFTVIGKSGGTGLSGGTKSAVHNAAEAIVDLIQMECK